MNRIIIFSAFLGLIATSCVTKKTYEAQQKQINDLELKLTQEQVAQTALQNRTRLLSDSVKMLLPEFKKQQVEFEYQTYKRAVNSGDKQLAAECLGRLLLLDTSQAYWVCDSLALYHYLYLMTPGVPRNNQTSLYYTLKGLELNPDNRFLLEMYGKVNLELQNDSVAYRTFRSLWEKYGDYTYLWEMTFMDLFVFQNIKRTEEAINAVTGAKESMIKMVRIEETEGRRIVEVPAKAAFLYFKASLQSSKGQMAAARKTLQEVLKIAPGFLAAQRGLYQLQGQAY